MAKQKPNLMDTWNTFAARLNSTKEAWDAHTALWAETSREEIEKLPVEFQRFLARNFNRSTFNVLLPRLVDYFRAYGGIEQLVVRIPKKEGN